MLFAQTVRSRLRHNSESKASTRISRVSDRLVSYFEDQRHPGHEASLTKASFVPIVA